MLGTRIDWILIAAILPLLGAGLLVMYSFSGNEYFFTRQLIWIALSLAVFFGLSRVDFHFLRRTGVLVTLFLISVVLLVAVLLVGNVVKGAQSWFSLGFFNFQPADPIKLVLILILAKYFSRRHIEIANIRHILVSGFYAAVPAFLILIQPDFGSALIIGAIWFGMIVVSGISKKHLLMVLGAAAITFGLLWGFAFTERQKDRIMTFIHPLADVRGAGYNAYQSTIAIGSGELFGKGFGYGTQSRLSFLPEHETDFVFAAFAEEWGFVGALIVLVLFGVVFWRILGNAMVAESNFEMLYAIGLAIFLMAHTAINIGMNVGLLPVTGLPLPFVSYGGSHLLTEFAGLGILMGMRRYARVAHREQLKNEVVGVG